MKMNQTKTTTDISNLAVKVNNHDQLNHSFSLCGIYNHKRSYLPNIAYSILDKLVTNETFT